MSAPVSTVPQAKTYLLGKLTSAIADAPGFQVLVRRDPPGEWQPDDIVTVGDCRNRTCAPWQMVGDGGTGWLKEEYELDVTISVFRPGDYADATNARAWELEGIVEQQVRADPAFGGLVICAYPLRSHDKSTWEDTHKGRITEVVLTVKIEAAL